MRYAGHQTSVLGALVVLMLSLQISVGAQKHQIWIGTRTDGKPGRGTADDPFDGGTQKKLDKLIATVPAKTTIHFSAGTFLTTGIQAKEGWIVAGAGKERTTIRLADNVVTGGIADSHSVISKFWDGIWLNRFELRDLTLDCNREHQPAFRENRSGFSLNAYLVAAKNAKVTNVRALGTWANPGEGFPCMILHDGTSGNPDRIEISGVENLNPIGYLTAISVVDQNGGSVTGFIRGCLVTDNLKGSCFGAGASRNFKIYRNRARNVNIGVNFDTYPANDLEIFANDLRAIRGWAVFFNNGSALDRVKIHDNHIEMTATGDAALFPGSVSASVDIYRNIIIQPNPKGKVINGGPGLHGSFHNNVIEAPNLSDFASVPNLTIEGNRDSRNRSLDLRKFQKRDRSN